MRYTLYLILACLLVQPVFAQRLITKGATDQTVYITIIDSGDGTPETGVTSATSGIDLEYTRNGAAPADLTESDLAATDSAHSDGGIKHIGGGVYRVDLPDAAVATGVNSVYVGGTITGMIVIGSTIQLTAFDLQDSTPTVDLTWPAAWDAEVQSEAQDAISATFSVAGGVVQSNCVQISGDPNAADNAELMFDGTGYAGGTTKLGVNVVQVEGTAPSSGGLLSAADVSTAVWNAATGSYGGAGTYGQAAEDILADTNELQSLWTTAGSLNDIIVAIDSKTTNLPTDPADDSDIDTQLATIAGYLDTEVAAILADTNEMQGDLANGGRLDLIFDATLKSDVAYGVTTTNGAITATFDSTP